LDETRNAYQHRHKRKTCIWTRHYKHY